MAGPLTKDRICYAASPTRSVDKYCIGDRDKDLMEEKKQNVFVVMVASVFVIVCFYLVSLSHAERAHALASNPPGYDLEQEIQDFSITNMKKTKKFILY